MEPYFIKIYAHILPNVTMTIQINTKFSPEFFSSSKKNVNEKTLQISRENCVSVMVYILKSEMTKYSSFSCKNVFRQKIERVRVELVRTD